MTMLIDEKDLIPCTDAKARCEAGGGSCGAVHNLFVTNGLVHCFHHASWPASDEAQDILAVRKSRAERQKATI